MSYLQRLASAATRQETVLTIGVFDGVHQGHRHLLRRLVQLAGNSYVPGVLTFSNHPITVLRPEIQVSYLSTPEEKVRLIKEQGVNFVVCLEFDHELSQVTAEDFASGLVESLGMKGLLMGPDSALGKGRQGDINYMKEQGSQMGFWVESVEPLTLDGTAGKSRRIRECVADGDVQACGKLLGRNFSLTG